MNTQKFFSFLRDEAWHSLPELAEQTEVDQDRLLEYSQFLAGKGIVIFEDKTQRIKIEPEWNHIIPSETEVQEPKSTLATFIIPGETTIEVQNTLISNLTQIKMEMTIRMDEKIREIAINF